MPLEKFDLNGKTALVTGAGKGLGKQMAAALAKAGANVAGTANSNLNGLEETRKIVEDAGETFLGIKADLTNKADMDKIVDSTINEFGKIDILINNAGTIQRSSVFNFTEKEWDEVMELNSKSLFFLSQKVVKTMKEKNIKGSITNVASLRVFQGGTNVVSYAASKGAVGSITKSLANELGEFGIRVNAIAPGYMDTEMTKPYQEDISTNNKILERTPLGRWGSPEDLDGAVVFLSSEASSFVTGETLVIDGGWMIR